MGVVVQDAEGCVRDEDVMSKQADVETKINESQRGTNQASLDRNPNDPCHQNGGISEVADSLAMTEVVQHAGCDDYVANSCAREGDLVKDG